MFLIIHFSYFVSNAHTGKKFYYFKKTVQRLSFDLILTFREEKKDEISGNKFLFLSLSDF
jgi:hypothetical protein